MYDLNLDTNDSSHHLILVKANIFTNFEGSELSRQIEVAATVRPSFRGQKEALPFLKWPVHWLKKKFIVTLNSSYSNSDSHSWCTTEENKGILLEKELFQGS